MTIYIVEIPHRLPPKVWTAADKAEFVNVTSRGEDFVTDRPIGEPDIDGNFNSYEPLPLDEQFDNAAECVASDLSSCMIFMSETEAREALAEVRNWKRHGGLNAKVALAAELGVEIET